MDAKITGIGAIGECGRRNCPLPALIWPGCNGTVVISRADHETL